MNSIHHHKNLQKSPKSCLIGDIIRIIFVSITLTAVLTVTGCSKQEQTAQKPAVAVELAAASATQLQEEIEVTGYLEPKFATDVRTQIPGLITDVYVTQWVQVKKGQALAKIDVSETEAVVRRAEAAVSSAKALGLESQTALNRAKREQARILKLKEAGLATQQAVDDSLSETEAANAKLEAANAQIRVFEQEWRQAQSRLSKGFVTAPMDGVVALRDVNVGDLAGDAASNKPIFRVVDSRILNLTVTVASVDSARIRQGQPLEFTVDSFPGVLFSGKVMFLNPELSEADRSLKVIAEVENKDGRLKGGLFAKGRIITGLRDNVLLLPRSVLGRWDSIGRTAVMLVAEGQTARQRHVKTGAVKGDMVEIVEGLAAGEQYVSRGGFTLRDGDRIVVEGAGKS